MLKLIKQTYKTTTNIIGTANKVTGVLTSEANKSVQSWADTQDELRPINQVLATYEALLEKREEVEDSDLSDAKKQSLLDIIDTKLESLEVTISEQK